MTSLKHRASGRSVVGLTGDPVAQPELVTKAILDGVDAIGREMERKWGVGRLRLLVGDALRIKFDAQKSKLDAAIAAGRETYIRAQAEGMRRAWLALDRAATEGGALALAPEVWECVLPESGEVVSVVRTEVEAHHVACDGEVWTVAEIAVLIERLGDQVREVKRRFPGSVVVEVRDQDPPSVECEKGAMNGPSKKERMAATFSAGPRRHPDHDHSRGNDHG
jgi:hypothetical protein